ncbi:MAG: protease inhibitor I9 family protein [Gemmatimonadaceae bacterium]
MRSRTIPVLAVAVTVAACSGDTGAPMPPTSPSLAAAPTAQGGKYFVILQDGANPDAVARAHGVRPIYTYTRALVGFAGPLTEGQRAELARDPQVRLVSPDESASLIAPTEGGQLQGSSSRSRCRSSLPGTCSVSVST